MDSPCQIRSGNAVQVVLKMTGGRSCPPGGRVLETWKAEVGLKSATWAPQFAGSGGEIGLKGHEKADPVGVNALRYSGS